ALKKETSSDNLTALLRSLEQINFSIESSRCSEIENQLYKLRTETDRIQIPCIQNIDDLKEKENFLLAQNRQIEVYGIRNLDKQLDTICAIEAKQKILTNSFFELKEKIQREEKDGFLEIADFLKKVKNLGEFEKFSKNFKKTQNFEFLDKFCLQQMNDLKTVYKIQAKNEKISELKNKRQTLLENLNYPLQNGVYGTIEENIELTDKKYRTAVNCAMGSRGKYVIVENEKIGKQVLKEFNKRISIIPLNKITSAKLYKKGRRLIDVIEYDKTLENAMEFVFGNFYLFEDKEKAKKMCFEENLLTITLDGTIYNPKGTLSGGKYFYRETQFKKSDIEGIERSIRNIYDEITRILDENPHLKSYFFDDEKENGTNTHTANLGYENSLSILSENITKFIDLKNEILSVCQNLLKTILEFDENIQKISFIKNLKNCNVKKELEVVRSAIISELKKKKMKEVEEKKLKEINAEIEVLEDEYRNELVEVQKLMAKKEMLEEKIKTEEKRRSVKIINERDIESLESRLEALNDSLLKINHKIRKEIKSIISHIEETHNEAFFVSKSCDESVEMSKILEMNGSF
ncbi:Structural maintenance of chromosomes protein 2, partial [Dictyocoela roeselum]